VQRLNRLQVQVAKPEDLDAGDRDSGFNLT
jgi:hypothetical protein